MNENDLIDKIKKLEIADLDIAVDDKVLADYHHNAEIRFQTVRQFPILSIIVIAAAVLVFGLGWYWINTRAGGENSASGPDKEVAMVSAGDRFYVLKTEADKESLVAQTFDDFTVKHSLVGAEIGGFVLAEVEEGAFSLRAKDGSILRMEIATWNRDSLSILEQEVLALRIRHQAGSMTESDLERLGAIARYGDISAVRVLKRIAAVPSNPYCKDAKQMLGGDNPEALAGLIAIARDRKGQSQYRKNILQTLAKLRTIQGSIVLQEIALDNKEPCQAFAVKVLVECGDKEALPILEKLCQNSGVPETTRQAARDAFEKLMQMNE
ncbi:hypothetical protein ACFL54_05685 [Planctomycetota bacterium]